MPPEVALKRRSLSPSAQNIRLLLIRSDPSFRERTLDGLAQVERGEFVTYEEIRDALQQRASAPA